MAFDHIENVKQEYTDKYVVVDGTRPELARFKDEVGLVKTVNMSGRALVEFIDYHLNIGWYDIDLDYLKVVDKPLPKEKKAEPKRPAAKPAAKKPAATDDGGKKLSPLEMARMQGGTKSAKPNADPPSEKTAAAKPAGKMSTADILAAARAKSAAAKAPAIEEPVVADPPGQVTEESIAVEAEAPAAEATEVATPGKVDKSTMSIADMIAHCRKVDA
jgi:hypothetical protein